MVLLGEPHLRASVRAFMDHCHEERPHQGLGNELIAPKMTVIGTGPIECRERLSGLLRFYYREAAWLRGSSSRTARGTDVAFPCPFGAARRAQWS